MLQRLGHIALWIVAASPAHAQSAPETPGSPPTLRSGQVMVSADVEINLSVRAQWQPVSVAPDAYVGVTDALTVGLAHSFRSRSLIRSGAGLCVRSSDAGCDRRYDNIGLDALYKLIDGRRVRGALRTRLAVRTFAPVKLIGSLGGVLDYRRGRFSVVTDPHIAFGLTHRDRGNEHVANLPVWLHARIAARLGTFLRTGVEGVIRGFRDTYRVGVGLGVIYHHRDVTIGTEFGMPDILGPLNDIKPRHVRAFVMWRIQAWPGS